MSMYELAFGSTSHKLGVAKLLGLEPNLIPRYRDLWIEKTNPASDDELILAVYTRVGGGNRDDYQSDIDALAAQPNYLGDEDDSFDSTYATFRFMVTRASIDQSWLNDEAKATDAEVWQTLQEAATEQVDPSERWQAAIDAIKGAAGA